jgi:hypothetical protein
VRPISPGAEIRILTIIVITRRVCELAATVGGSGELERVRANGTRDDYVLHNASGIAGIGIILAGGRNDSGTPEFASNAGRTIIADLGDELWGSETS